MKKFKTASQDYIYFIRQNSVESQTPLNFKSQTCIECRLKEKLMFAMLMRNFGVLHKDSFTPVYYLWFCRVGLDFVVG